MTQRGRTKSPLQRGEEKKRKYYRVKVHRIPPYSFVNSDYYYEEDVWAYSSEGALNKIAREHRGSYGKHIPIEVTEITKEDFRGDKETDLMFI